MTTCRAFLRLVRETFDELRHDFEEIFELVLEQIGLDEAWLRRGTAVNALMLFFRPSERKMVCGRHRSLIRMIGSQLKLKPVKRVQIRVLEAIRNDIDRRETSLEVPIGLQELLVNERNVYNNQIKHRWSSNQEQRPFLESEDLDDDFLDDKRNNDVIDTSTPKKRTPALEQSRNEVVSLHAELERLRLQIASIVTIQECVEKKRTMAPPPPPPPLPPKALFKARLNERISVNNLEQVPNRMRSQHTIDQVNRVNLIEILKDIGNVKLRKTDRSPGGTPFRRKAKFEPDANDPAAIMASALKKRFAHHLQALQESLEKENIDTDPDDSIWDTSSPFTSPVKSLSSPHSVQNNHLHCKSIGVAF